MNLPSSAADIHRALVALADRGAAFALVVVLKEDGSTPRKAGAKALIEAGGAIQGTIGGGQVEAETQRRAVVAIRSGQPLVFDFTLAGSCARDDRPICGGVMRLLIDPAAAQHRAAYARAVEAERRRQRGVLLTAARVGSATGVVVRWLPPEAATATADFPGGPAIGAVLEREAPELFIQDLPQAGAQLQVLVEPLVPAPQLVIAGGGHIGQALAVQAGLVGFAVTVIDDRPAFTAPALYPAGVTTRCGDIARELAAWPMAADTFVAIVTRGHQQDRAALAACVRQPAGYLGMIGSRRKVALLRQDLLASGAATATEFDRVYAPIGLDIGAQTVPEIAASIVAQLIAVRRRGRAPRFPAR